MNIHTKTAIDSIRRSPFQAIAAIFVLSVTFFVGTIISILAYSSTQALNYFETRPQVIAFLKSDVEAEGVSELQNKLAANNKVAQLKYVSKEEALAIYKTATSDNPLLSELVSPSVFPASLEFSLTNLEFADEVISQLKEEEIVDSVGFTASLGGESTLDEVVNRLRTITLYVRIGGGAFFALLGVTSLLVLLIIISMRMTTRRGEVDILNLIGATSSFIRSPIILEAVIYVVVGVLFGWVTTLIFVLYSTPAIISYFGEIPVLPRDTLDMLSIFGIILAAELILGALLALIGSSLAVARVKKTK